MVIAKLKELEEISFATEFRCATLSLPYIEGIGDDLDPVNSPRILVES